MRIWHIAAAFLCLLFSQMAYSQDGTPYDFKQADSLIQKLSEEADFLALSKKLKQHIQQIETSGIADSLYKYVYTYGRTEAELNGNDSAIVKTEEFVTKIIELDSNKSHQLSALSDLAWIYIEAGNDSMCYETDLRYLEIVESYPEASPREKYLAHYSLGYDFELLGKTKEAITHFHKALDAVKPDSLNQIVEMMDGNNGLGAALWRKGDLEKAKKAFEKSIYYSQFYEDSLKALMYKANALGNLSLVYEDQGNLVMSKDLLEQSLKSRKVAIAGLKDIYQKDQQTRHLIRNYHNLAALYLDLGDLERSKKMTSLCERLRRENLPESHPDQAKSFEAYGSIAFAQGNYEEALEYFQMSLETFEKAFGKYSTQCVNDHIRIGKAYHALGNDDLAIEHLSTAAEIAIEVSSEESNQELAKSYVLRSIAYRSKGNYKKAESDLNSALSIYSNTRSDQNFMFGILYLDMAHLKSDQGLIDSAIFYVDKAIELGAKVSVKNFSKFNAQLKFLPEAYGEKAFLVSLKKDESNLNEALELALKGKELIKRVRINYEEEISQIALYEQQSDIFNTAIDIAFDLYTLTGNRDYIDRIHELSEESKSIILRQQLNKFTSLRVNAVPDTLLSEEYRLLSIISGKVSGISPEELLNAEKQYSDLLQIFKTDYPEYYQLRYEEKTVSIETLQKSYLKEGQNLIEYVFTEEAGYGILINKDRTELKKLDRQSVEKEIENYNTYLIRQDAQLINSSFRVYQSLFKPFQTDILGKEVIIIPDNGIFNLNFETLSQDIETPNLLIYEYDISYLLSATTAFQYRQLENRKGSGLMALAPGFTDEMKREYLQGVEDSVFLDKQYLSSIQQPFSIQTAKQIAGLFSGEAFVTQDATEQNFKDLASEYSILHLGTHTEINNLSPLLSKFILTKPKSSQGEDDDGYLHAYEIYNMPLRAELAVLTACETGIGKETSAEGVLSIAHSFAYAGCPSIVMSIWQIDEKTSAEIIGYFYEYLKDGQEKNKALRNAKLKYLENNPGELSHPYYWSGLVLVGNTDAVSSTEGFLNRNGWWIGALIGGLLAFLLVRQLRIRKKSA